VQATQAHSAKDSAKEASSGPRAKVDPWAKWK